VPRGFKVDYELLRERQARDPRHELLGGMDDPRTFVSLPKVTSHTNGKAVPHILAFGIDKEKLRAEIFRRNRQAHGGVNRCVECHNEVYEDTTEEEFKGWSVPWNKIGEWHHIRNKPGERCDCVENGEVRCKRCHSKEHPKPFPKKAQNKGII
jgi:hypothetical protein